MAGIVKKAVGYGELQWLLEKELVAGGPMSQELADYLGLTAERDTFRPVELEEHEGRITDGLLEITGNNNFDWKVDTGVWQTVMSMYIPGREHDQNDLFVVVIDTAVAQYERPIAFFAMVSRALLLHLYLQDKNEALKKAVIARRLNGRKFPINNLGELREAVAACDGLPDSTFIANQVVGNQSGAWNLGMDFMPQVPNGTIACFSMSHPRLDNLPMNKEDANIDVFRED